MGGRGGDHERCCCFRSGVDDWILAAALDGPTGVLIGLDVFVLDIGGTGGTTFVSLGGLPAGPEVDDVLKPGICGAGTGVS